MENRDYDKHSMNPGGEELDLVVFFKWCLAILSNYVVRPLLYCVRLILRRWYVVLTGMLLSVVVLFFWCRAFPRYHGYMIIQNNVWRSTDFVMLVDQLNLLAPYELQSRLGVDSLYAYQKRHIGAHLVYSTDTLKMGSFIDYYNVYYKPHENRMDLFSSRFCVEVQSESIEGVRVWQNALVKYLQENPYVKDLNEERLSKLEEQCVSIQREIGLLDSLRNKEYFGTRKLNLQGGMVYMAAPEMYHPEIFALEDRLRDAEFVLKNNRDAITVVSDMHVDGMELNFWIHYIDDALLWGVALSLLLLLLLDNRTQVRSFLRN